MLTLEQILAAKTPEAIFSAGQTDVVRAEFKKLAMEYHSDHNKDPRATDAFKIINELYHRANDQIKRGIWEIPNRLLLRTLDGKEHRIKYLTKHDISIGTMYVSHSLLTFTITKENKDLLDNFVNNTTFHYVDQKMSDEFARYFPKIRKQSETEDFHVLYVDKPLDTFCLADVINATGKVPATHVAWILNRLYNIILYLNFYDRTHNDLSLTSLFVCPGMHTICPLGGWWSATTAKAPLVSLPERSMKLAPSSMISRKVAASSLDLECVKLLGRELFGDPHGTRLTRDPDVPKDIAAFLRHPSSGKPNEDFQEWNKVLRRVYGPPKFKIWDLSAKEVYREDSND